MSFEPFAAIASVLITAIPGIAAGFALFHGMKFSRLDKIILGSCISLIGIPMLLFLEYMAFGWQLNVGLVLANALLVLFAGIGGYYLQAKTFTFTLDLPKLDVASAKKYGPALFVLLMMALAFYVRFAPAFTTTFYEFDPYYYMKLTERLVQNGQIAMFTDDSFFPKQQFQHWPPLEHYLTGSWTLLHQWITGQGYDQNTMVLVSEIYPPLVGALICFIAFVLIREEYNAYYGAVAAATYAFLPQLIQKFGAGVTEQQPWAMFLALLFFMVLMLSLRQNSLRLGAFAAFTGSAILMSSQQYIWPLMVFVAFAFLQSVLYFVSSDFGKRKIAILAAAGVGMLFGNTAMAAYQNQQYNAYFSGEVILVLASVVFSAILFFATGFFKDKLRSKTARLTALGALAAIVLVVAALTPIGQIAAGKVISYATVALNTNSLSKTIAENGTPSPAIYESAYGVMSPPVLLLLAALVPLLSAAVLLFSKKHVKWGSAALLLGLSLLFFKGAYETLFKTIFGAGPSILLTFVQNDVFGFLLIGLGATALIYLFSTHENRTESTMFMMLVFFPVAFIAATQLKYLLHLGFVLALLFPFLLGEIQRMAERLNDWFKFVTNHATLRMGVLVILLFVGGVASFAQALKVQNSMDQLSYSRLPVDWVATYQWMSNSSPSDTRVMSWWDYGHWTTFLGQRKTVLNPSNLYGGYDQGVARAFVNGNPADLYDRMEFHNATHVLVDGDLIGKWGALVYLSGTCPGSEVPICPQKPDIDPKNSPGQNQYEVEHYFEYLSVAGNCPAGVLGIQVPMLQSNLGARYCMTQTDMVYLTGQGQVSNVTRKYKLAGRDEITSTDKDTSYLFAVGQNQFVNINPYFEPFGLHNNVFDAAFTKMFFFDNYPGFKLAYRSPNSYVKVFEYTGRPNVILRPVPKPSATPTATPLASGTANGSASSGNSSASPQNLADQLAANAKG
ncbi:hypothetical protein HY994_06935 [Candidatus Micrarchaeota archaeon]|nr:hypothetical protein [Candidatus Micrarchaeota archaeon]